jgi:hypothetical protein
MNSKAYERGFNDFNPHGINECPYEAGTSEFFEWCDGNRTAYDEQAYLEEVFEYSEVKGEI